MMDECPALKEGNHDIDWVEVPAQYHRTNGEEPKLVYPDHRRGVCFWCDMHFSELQ